MQDRKNKLTELTLCAVFLAVSVIISIVESISGVNAFIPLPGVRLGFCNIATAACFYLVSVSGAFAIAAVRPFFTFLFSGNPMSFVMGLCGSLLAFFSLVLTRKCYGRVFSFAGVSCISAVFHSLGQIFAAMIIMDDIALLWYLPTFLMASSVAGSVSGSIMNFVIPRLPIKGGRI